MVIDSSAILSILLGEPDAPAFAQAIAAARERYISAVSLLETSMVLVRKHGPSAVGELDRVIADAAVVVVPFDAEQAGIGRQAFHRFGKGLHPAGLNFGDCAAYALARSRGQPLLFKGSGFSTTDVEVPLPLPLP